MYMYFFKYFQLFRISLDIQKGDPLENGYKFYVNVIKVS